MKRTLLILALVSAPLGAANAGPECAPLGLGNSFLADHFCEELKSLANLGSGTRSVTGDNDELAQKYLEFELIRDAYRADPRKTLELIKRIKSAGGLPDQ